MYCRSRSSSACGRRAWQRRDQARELASRHCSLLGKRNGLAARRVNAVLPSYKGHETLKSLKMRKCDHNATQRYDHGVRQWGPAIWECP